MTKGGQMLVLTRKRVAALVLCAAVPGAGAFAALIQSLPF